MDLTAEKGRKVKRISKKEEPKGSLEARSTCTRLGSWDLRCRGVTGTVPCRRLLPCRGAPPRRRLLPCRGALPCRGMLPCRRTLPWRRSRSRWHVRGGLRALLVELLCSYTSQRSDISKQIVSMRA